MSVQERKTCQNTICPFNSLGDYLPPSEVSQSLAFPQLRENGEVSQKGLTKREYVAIHLTAAILSNVVKLQGEWTGQLTPDFLTDQALKVADKLCEKLGV